MNLFSKSLRKSKSEPEQELQAKIANLEKHDQQLLLLQEINAGMSSVMKLDELLQLVVDSAKRLSGVGGAGIALVNQDTHTARISNVSSGDGGLAEKFLRTINVSLLGREFALQAESLVVRCLESRQPYVTDALNDLTKDILTPFAGATLQRILRAKKIALFPLYSDDQPFAILACLIRFEEVPLDILTHFTHQCERAIKSARMLDEAQQQSQRLQQLLEKSNEELRRSEGQYRELVDNIGGVVFMLGQSGNIVFVNQDISISLGYEQGEVMGKPFSEFLDANDRETARNMHLMVLRDGQKVENSELRLKHKDGSLQWHSVKAVPVRDEGGAVTGLLGISHNIAEMKKTEEQLRDYAENLERMIDGSTQELRDSEKRYRTFLKQTTDGVYIRSLDGKMVFINEAGSKMLGFSSSDEAVLVFNPHTSLVQNDKSKRFYDEFRKLGGHCTNIEVDYYRKDGSVLTCELTTDLVEDEQGIPRYVQGIFRDISERKKTAAELMQSTRRLSVLNEIAAAASRMLNLNDLYRIIHEQICQIFRLDGFFIDLYDPQTQTMTSVINAEVIDGVRTILEPGARYSIYESPLRDIVFDGVPKLLHREPGDTESAGLRPFDDTCRRACSLMYVAMVARDDVAGVMWVQSHEVAAYTQDDVDLLQNISNCTAVAIQNARLYQQAKDSEEKFRMLTETSLDGAAVYQGNRCVYVNPAFLRILGYENLEEIQDQPLDSLLLPEQWQASNEKEERVFQERSFLGYAQNKIRRKDGAIVELEVSASTTVYEGKTALQIVLRDVTKAKRIEAELKHREQEMRFLHDMTLQMSETLSVREVFKIVATVVGSVLETESVLLYLLFPETGELHLVESENVSLRFIEAASVLEPGRDLLGRAIQTDQPIIVTEVKVDERCPAIMKEESYEVFISIPLISKGKAMGVVSAGSRKRIAVPDHLEHFLFALGSAIGTTINNAQLYDELMKKSKELEERNRELNDFTYIISHELKNPLFGIEGMLQVIAKEYGDHLPTEAKEYIGSVVQSSLRMRQLISDLLNLARIGRDIREYQFVEAQDVVQTIKTDALFLMKGKTVVFRIQEKLPAIYCNPTQITEVFRNLISNAIKFTDKPVPEVEIACVEEDGFYKFSVKDNGIGIDRLYYDKIFYIFQRLNPTSTEGTGAGLTIAKKIVERHGGKIWVDSEVEKGSTFYFTLPKYTGA